MTQDQDRWEITLPWEKPPLNLNTRGHWATKARWTSSLRGGAHLLAIRHRVPFLEVCTVTLLWEPPPDGRRRDEDNIYPTMKALADGLVDAGVTRDDTPDLMRKVCRIGAPRRPQRLSLIIERGLL